MERRVLHVCIASVSSKALVTLRLTFNPALLTFFRPSFANSEQAPAKLDFTLNAPDGLGERFWGETSWCVGISSSRQNV